MKVRFVSVRSIFSFVGFHHLTMVRLKAAKLHVWKRLCHGNYPYVSLRDLLVLSFLGFLILGLCLIFLDFLTFLSLWHPASARGIGVISVSIRLLLIVLLGIPATIETWSMIHMLGPTCDAKNIVDWYTGVLILVSFAVAFEHLQYMQQFVVTRVNFEWCWHCPLFKISRGHKGCILHGFFGFGVPPEMER